MDNLCGDVERGLGVGGVKWCYSSRRKEGGRAREGLGRTARPGPEGMGPGRVALKEVNAL